MKKTHIGSKLDDLLKEDRLLEGAHCDGDQAGHRSSDRHGDEATPSHEDGDGEPYEDEPGYLGSAP